MVHTVGSSLVGCEAPACQHLRREGRGRIGSPILLPPSGASPCSGLLFALCGSGSHFHTPPCPLCSHFRCFEPFCSGLWHASPPHPPLHPALGGKLCLAHFPKTCILPNVWVCFPVSSYKWVIKLSLVVRQGTEKTCFVFEVRDFCIPLFSTFMFLTVLRPLSPTLMSSLNGTCMTRVVWTGGTSSITGCTAAFTLSHPLDMGKWTPHHRNQQVLRISFLLNGLTASPKLRILIQEMR